MMMSATVMPTMSVRPVRRAAVRSTPVAKADGVAKGLSLGMMAGLASFTLSMADANAATIKMGDDSGGLAFVPAVTNAKAGEDISFVNNKAFPHNVVFDGDNVPGGVDADAISHEALFNGPGETYTLKLSKPGTYEFYCAPHQGAGMQGKIVIS